MTIAAAEAPLDWAAMGRRLRGPAAFVAIALVLLTLLALVGRVGDGGPLDPRNAAGDGGRALAALLSHRGDSVRVVTRIADINETATTTVLLSDANQVSDRALRALAESKVRLVVVQPDNHELKVLGTPAQIDDQTGGADIQEPDCSLPAAITAGSVRLDGDLYAAESATAVGCYHSDGDAGLLSEVRGSGATTVVLGSGSLLTNAHLAAQGDAALALGMLDSRVIDWAPGRLDPGATPGAKTGLLHLLPARLLWAVLQLFIAIVVLALWRGRRLGKVVAEPLPVIVRAAETVEGRGRLLRAARARAGAASSLREATTRRLGRGVSGAEDDAGRAGVVALVADQSGRDPAQIDVLLYGGTPQDDAALVQLGQELADLERTVRGRATVPTTKGDWDDR